MSNETKQSAKYVYENPWGDGTHAPRPHFYTSYEPPKFEYKGFQVFFRSGAWEYVFKGCCITQRAGSTLFKSIIDGLLNGRELVHNDHAKAVLEGKEQAAQSTPSEATK